MEASTQRRNKRRTIRINKLLDWQAIDKTILIAVFCLNVPLIYGGTIAYGFLIQLFSEQSLGITFNPSFTLLYLTIHLIHLITLSILIFIAIQKRRSQEDWVFFWYVVALSWVTVTLVTNFLAGTMYTNGMLMLLTGFTISLPLQPIQSLMRTYSIALILFITLTCLDLSKTMPSGLLFDGSPYADNSLWPPLHYAKIFMALSTFGLAYIAGRCIASWREREQIYRQLSTIDSLTQLSNRGYFFNRGHVEFNHAVRRKKDLACIIIDLDYFKDINDNYGHQAGDKVLIAVADILSTSARNYDEVSRIGGEEFAILMPVTNIEAAAQVATRIRRKLEKITIMVDGQHLKVTASMGVSAYPDNAVEDISALLKRADDALYVAKRSGRNKVISATPEKTSIPYTA